MESILNLFNYVWKLFGKIQYIKSSCASQILFFVSLNVSTLVVKIMRISLDIRFYMVMVAASNMTHFSKFLHILSLKPCAQIYSYFTHK